MSLPEMAARLAVLSLILLGVVMVIGYFFQGTLIYYPQAANRAALEPLAAREGLLPWRDAEGNFIGWHNRRGAGIPVLILHGNAGHSLHRVSIVSRLRDAGVNPSVFICGVEEWRGCG